MGYKVKPFTMSVRNNSTQEFEDVTFLGSDVNKEVSDLKQADTLINNRIDNIVAQSGDDITEIVDARNSADGTTYTALKARLDAENTQLKSHLAAMSTAEASDVGKALVAKTVTDRKVTEWDFSEIGSGTGLSDDAKLALLACFRKVAWIDDQGQTYYDNLYDALFSTMTSIVAVFSQGGNTIYDTQTLEVLRQYLVVTAVYDNGTEQTVTDYVLSGTLTAGTSVITVTYQGLTTTFNVTVTADPAYITAVYTQTGTVYVNDSVDSLKTDLVVTYFANSHSAGVVLTDSDYTLSGTLTVGTSTVTVSYNGLTTTFTVTVTSRRNPDLPNTYEQVEYITANGTKYIDTGVLSQVPFVANIKAYWTNADATFLGGESGGTDRFYICARTWASGGIYILNRFGNTDWFGDFNHPALLNTLYEIESGILPDNSDAKAYISYDNSYAEHTIAVPTTGKEIDIFRNPVDNNISPADFVRVHSVQFYAGSGGTKLFDGIPCYRKSDNVSGLYDTVSETFLSGTGTGNFGIGSIVY